MQKSKNGHNSAMTSPTKRKKERKKNGSGPVYLLNQVIYTLDTNFMMPGAVARPDPRPPGMRTVAGSVLTSGNILSWSLAKIISTAILSERMCTNSISTGKLPRRLVQEQCGYVN